MRSLFGQCFREVPLKSRTLSEVKPRNVVRGNRVLNGDFLTLAPPTAVGKGNQQDLSNSASQNSELFKFETVPFQVSDKRTSASYFMIHVFYMNPYLVYELHRKLLKSLALSQA